MLEKKTLTQIGIEINVTNERSYQTVPYTKLLGQKRALKQWLLFSNERCIGRCNHNSDETSFLAYVVSTLHYKINKLKKGLESENYLSYIMGKSKIKFS